MYLQEAKPLNDAGAERGESLGASSLALCVPRLRDKEEKSSRALFFFFFSLFFLDGRRGAEGAKVLGLGLRGLFYHYYYYYHH